VPCLATPTSATPPAACSHPVGPGRVPTPAPRSVSHASEEPGRFALP
jgi:hypothetical protein